MKKQKKHVSESQTIPLGPDDFRELVRRSLEEKIRAVGIAYIHELLNEEIEYLCGPTGSHKKGAKASRGGSESGWISLNGQRIRIRKPRVRKDGREVELQSYQVLQSMDNLGDVVSRMMLNGVSTRGYDRVLSKFDNDLGLSKSSASRQFVKKSRESLNTLNMRRFPDSIFWALLIDGIEFGGSVVIVAMGVDMAGNKHILGVSEGSTENHLVVVSLLENIQEREIEFSERILAVLDGSKALKKAVKGVFGKRVEIQRCFLHKRRNVESKLDKKDHFEFKRRMTRGFNSNSFEDADRSLKGTLNWLEKRNYSAARSLEEGYDELLTLHRLEMPLALRSSFYTTNLIESAFSNPRNHTNRVKRWRRNTDQVLRWSGSLLLSQEERFRRVNGFKDISGFIASFSPKMENKVAENAA